MSTILFNLIAYYVISGFIALGTWIGESHKWHSLVITFILGFILLPLMLGKALKRIL